MLLVLIYALCLSSSEESEAKSRTPAKGSSMLFLG
jgi:hypothetical protein